MTIPADVIGTIVPVAICGLFMLSAAKKLALPRSVAQMIQTIGVPVRFVGILATGLVVTELLAGVTAVWPAMHITAGILTAVLGTSFGIAAAVTLRAKRVVLCACFGTSRVPLGMAHILRAPVFWTAAAV